LAMQLGSGRRSTSPVAPKLDPLVGVKVKFHYAIQVADRSRLVADLLAR